MPRETLDPQGMLAGATCLVTGGAGFVGSHIVELLLDAGAAEVRVIDNMVRGRRDNLARALASNRVRLIEGDIRDTATMKSLVAGCDSEYDPGEFKRRLGNIGRADECRRVPWPDGNRS